MSIAKLKKHKDKYEINMFQGKGSRSHYNNIIDKDPNKIALILMDLSFEGFPIDKAILIYQAKMNKRDWLGL